MIQTLVVTLGNLGEALLASAERIIGASSRVTSLSLDWGSDVETWKAELQKRLASYDSETKVILLTDMFGGSATNIALQLYKEGAGFEVVTGVNLPMLVKAVTLSDGISLSEAADQLRTQGRKSIYIAGEML